MSQQRAETLASAAKHRLRQLLPLAVRKQLSIRIGRSRWLPDSHRYYWSMEAVRDLAERDPDAFHRFLWTHHLAYAETYEVESRFDPSNVHPTRHLLFGTLEAVLSERGMDPRRDVASVLEVGCSLGYLLRHLETDLFCGAERLDGFDIDEHAIAAGSSHLARLGSRVRLAVGDMGELDRLVAGRSYDVAFCAGTLMYLREPAAARVVEVMLRHTRGIVVLAGLADPHRDNRELASSGVRARDRSFIHNLDRMVEAAGGRVVQRDWRGAEQIDGNSIYFVFAEPARVQVEPAPLTVAAPGGP